MVFHDNVQDVKQTGIFMATDMQPLFSTMPSHNTPAVPEGRDRLAGTQHQTPARDFDSVLGRAEARQNMNKPEVVSVRNTAKPGAQARTAPHAKPESSPPQGERSTGSERPEQTISRNESAREKDDATTAKSDEPESTQETKKKTTEQGNVPQEVLVAAMMVPPVQTAPCEGQATTPTETKANKTEGAIEAMPAIAIPATETTGSSPGTGTVTAGVTTGDPSVNGAAVAAAEPGKEEKQVGEKSEKKAASNDGQQASKTDAQALASEAQPAQSDKPLPSVSSEPEKQKPVLAGMTVSKQEPKLVEQGQPDQSDRPNTLNVVSQGTSWSEGQAGAGAGQFLEKDSQRFSFSASGGDRSLPTQTSALDANNRPAFLDRMNGLIQPAPSNSESASGRGEVSQATTVARASETERFNELRGATQISQSVTLDLDPLDMGPLRVRVMMSDQTVHAHIRTEHGELGQGLLQQGQSLESSLRTTGLEMGMLRVTVDQQQGRGDNAWMFQQQSHGRPGSADAQHSPAGEDERSVRGERPMQSTDRVSFFA